MLAKSLWSVEEYLEASDDDEKESVGREEDPGLLDGAAVAEEGDEEDEGPGGDQDVGALLDHRRLSQLLLSTHETFSENQLLRLRKKMLKTFMWIFFQIRTILVEMINGKGMKRKATHAHRDDSLRLLLELEQKRNGKRKLKPN